MGLVRLAPGRTGASAVSTCTETHWRWCECCHGVDQTLHLCFEQNVAGNGGETVPPEPRTRRVSVGEREMIGRSDDRNVQVVAGLREPQLIGMGSLYRGQHELNLVRSSLAMLFLEGPAPLRRWLLRTMVSPRASIENLIAVREHLLEWAAARATPFYHPVGTCRMGAADDSDAVVDPDCRVHGVERLRVIDVSIMPTITRAATHLTTIMVAEKMADRLKALVLHSSRVTIETH